MRNRIQGIEESTTNYYHDVIDLFRVVDPTMAEATKVDYLFGGLRPSLVQKFYPLQPKTSEEFLKVIKRFKDVKLLANRRNWPDAVLGIAETGQADIPVEFIRSYPKPTPSAADTELWKVIKELQGAVENLKLKATPPPKRPGNDKTVTWGETRESTKPTMEVSGVTAVMEQDIWPVIVGKIRSHLVLDSNNTQVRLVHRGGAPGPTTPINIVPQLAETTMDSVSLESNKELPILKWDFSKLVREEVTCGKRRVMAVVDTGAALTVICPELL